MTTYDSATRDALQALGGAGHKAYAQLDQILTSQAYMMSTVDYFTLLGWMFMGLIVIVWLAKPPFAAKAGPEASGH
jgi:DHA2 family multidrug resistance protein